MSIESNIDRYLQMESGGKERGLERLLVAIHNEVAERREGEDWSDAKDYVRSLLRRMTQTAAPGQFAIVGLASPLHKEFPGTKRLVLRLGQ